LPTIYGENEAEHRLIPYTIKAIRNNEKLNFTSGDQIRQYIYVDDVACIIFKSVEIGLESGIFNIAGNETLSVREVVGIIIDNLGITLSDDVFGKVKRTDTNMQNLQLDGSRLNQQISLKGAVRIADVIDKYIEKTLIK
jgi:nucleoside-diphosphate-sugar epimerase